MKLEATSTDQSRGELSYRPEIDGLRAVAVLLVIFFHTGLGFSGGYIGVDVFFVISGYLITRIIVADLKRGSFSLVGFWERRLRRILPAAAAVSVCTLAVGYGILLPRDLVHLGNAVISLVFLCANHYFWHTGGYFDGPAELKPLLHTWSLSVEEQFYLGLPLILLAVWRWARRLTIPVLAGIAGLSLLASWRISDGDGDGAFFLLPTRAWELASGCLLCWLPSAAGGRQFKELMAAVGLAAIGFASVTYDRFTVVPGVASLLPVMGAAMFIHANGDRLTGIGRCLSVKPIVFVGLISYSLYLWHWPLLAFWRYSLGPADGWQRVGLILGAIALAAVTWRWVEQPFRKRQVVPGRRMIGYGFAAIGVLLATSTGFVLADGMKERFPEQVVRILDSPDWHRRKQFKIVRHGDDSWGLPDMGASPTNGYQFILWGDSYAGVVAETLHETALDRGLAGKFAVRGATAPLLDVWQGPRKREQYVRWNYFVRDYILSNQIPNVILIAAWDCHAARWTGISDENNAYGMPLWDPGTVIGDALDRLADDFRRHGVRLWVFKQPPFQGMQVPHRVGVEVANGRGEVVLGVDRNRDREFRRTTERTFAALKDKANVVDCVDRFFPDGIRSIIGREDTPLYVDAGHLSKYGVDLMLRPELEKILATVATVNP